MTRVDEMEYASMRIVQVGVGRAGSIWATLVQETDGIELAGVVDADPVALARVQDELGLPAAACAHSLAAALEQVDAEAVLVVTPPATHAAVAIEALRAGKHVLTEKPLAMDLTEAAAMLRAAREAGRTLMVAQNYRFVPPARAVQRAVAGGALGDLLAVRIAFRRDVRHRIQPGRFHYAMPHPLLLDMTIHHVDLLRAVTGRDVATVYARSWPAPDASFIRHPSVAAVLTLVGGTVATYDGDWVGGGGDTSWNGNWEFTGTGGRLVWRGGEPGILTGDLTLHPWDGPPETLPLPVLAATERAGLLAAFRDAVAAGTQPETDAADNVRSLAAVLAAARSVDTGEVVDVAELLDTLG